MPGDTTVQVQSLLDALRRGDPDARLALTARAVGRIRVLAATVINFSFPDYRTRVNPDDMLGDVWIRLDQAIDAVRPATADDFFGLVRKKCREVLFDLVRNLTKRAGRESPLPSTGGDVELPGGLAESTHDPARLELWTEFHRIVETLEGLERQVFEMHWYDGFTQAEIAAELGLTPKQVSRLWLATTEKIADRLPGFALL